MATLAAPKERKSSSKQNSRPGRSNSLQRMLDLEKQCMLDRRHAHPTPDNATAGSPGSVSASSHLQHQHLSSSQHHQQQQQQQQQQQPQPQPPPRGRQPPADIAPLFLARHPNIQSPTPRALNIQKQLPHLDQSQTQDQDRVSHTTITFQPDQQQSRRIQQQQQQHQQHSKPNRPPPLTISTGGDTTNIAAALAPEPGPAREKKEDRRGNRGGAGAGGLSPGTVSVLQGSTAVEASRGTQSPAKSTTIAAAPAPAPAPAPVKHTFLPDLKVVTFLEPAPTTTPTSLDDRESVCHSPSWEAYGRRKKEKKRESKEKRKLTKVPPSPTSAPASAAAGGANSYFSKPATLSTSASKAAPSQSPSVQAPVNTTMSDSRTRHAQAQLPLHAADRSASALASHGTDFPLDMPPPPVHTSTTPRSRSGSFSSIFKAPFEFRRPSIDHDKERQTGFIGGIKLEQHRNESHQRALDESMLGPNGEIHPAFRRERRSSSPLRFFTSRQPSREPEDRHYPPIAINTSKNQALLASEPSGNTSDGGMMKKWRQRVGLKGSSKGSESDTEGPSEKKTRGRRLSKSAQRDQSATPLPPSGTTAAHGKSVSTSALDLPPATRPALAPSPLKSWQGISPASKAPVQPAEYVDHDEHANYTLPPISPLSPYSLTHDADHKDGDARPDEPSPLTPDDLPQPTLAAADDVAPPPPRKSSKRKSLISLNDADLLDGTKLPNPLGINPPTPFLAHSTTDGTTSSASLSDARATKPSSAAADKKAPGKLSKAHRQSISNPPSIPYDAVSPNGDSSAAATKRTLRDAARAAFGRPTSSASQYAAVPNATSPSRPTSRSRPSYYSGSVPPTETRHLDALAANNGSGQARDSISLGKPARILGEADWRTGFTPTVASPPTNSSDDSGTDDGHDGHAPDTPDTSRPQSERGGSFDHIDMKRPRPVGVHSALPSPTHSTSSEPRMSTEKPAGVSTVELDNVQTAAMKVLAAFPDAAPKRPNSSDWRCSSDSNLTVSFLPKTNRTSFQSSRDRSKPRPIKTNVPPARDSDSKSPPLRDLLMAKDESAATAPWPATYLEAARKAAPAAAAPKPVKQQQQQQQQQVSASTSTPNLAPPKRITPNRSRQSSPGPSNLSHQRNQSSSTGTSASGTLSSASSTGGTVSAQVDGEPIAKMFVECCACKFYHDMPSKLYEAMAHPEDVVPGAADNVVFAGALSMTVKCPWCKHEMSTKCCAGLAAMVYVKERLH